MTVLITILLFVVMIEFALLYRLVQQIKDLNAQNDAYYKKLREQYSHQISELHKEVQSRDKLIRSLILKNTSLILKGEK